MTKVEWSAVAGRYYVGGNVDRKTLRSDVDATIIVTHLDKIEDDLVPGETIIEVKGTDADAMTAIDNACRKLLGQDTNISATDLQVIVDAFAYKAKAGRLP